METDKNAIEKNKLLILCLLKAFDQRLSDNQLLSVCTLLSLMDYFDLNTSLHELAQADLLEKSEAVNGVFYSITPIGDSTYDFFKKQLPFSQRETVRQYAEEHKDELLAESRIFSEYMQISENQFRVIMKILENNLSIFELSLFAHTKEEAESFSVAWRKKAMDIYSSTLDHLIK